MRLLVTGGDGQVGFELARQAVDAQMTVKAATREELDITDKGAVDKLITAFAPDLVVNAAAYTNVDRAESERDLAFAVNESGPENLAKSTAALDIPLIHISTDYVFDGSKSSPYVETDPTGAIGVYGASKLAGELLVQEHCPKHVIVRSAWVFGTHGANFVKTMLRVGAQRPELSVVGDQVGCPTYAADLTEAILGMARKLDGRPDDVGLYGTFHCVGAGSTSWCGFAREIFRLAGQWQHAVPSVREITAAEYPTPAIRPVNSRLDCSKLSEVYGIEMRTWQDALLAMLTKLQTQA